MNSKMKMMAVLFCALLVMGCATARVMTTTNKKFAPSNPDMVKLFMTDKPTTPFEEIGRVSVDKYSNLAISRSGDEMYKKIREKAASIGGDAIINITEDFGSMNGVVIKFLTEPEKNR